MTLGVGTLGIGIFFSIGVGIFISIGVGIFFSNLSGSNYFSNWISNFSWIQDYYKG